MSSLTSSPISPYFFVYLWISKKVDWFSFIKTYISNWLTYVVHAKSTAELNSFGFSDRWQQLYASTHLMHKTRSYYSNHAKKLKNPVYQVTLHRYQHVVSNRYNSVDFNKYHKFICWYQWLNDLNTSNKVLLAKFCYHGDMLDADKWYDSAVTARVGCPRKNVSE